MQSSISQCGSFAEQHGETINRQENQTFSCDKKKKKKSGNLSTFPADDPVMMKFGDTWKRAEVESLHSTPRSCLVRDEGRQYRRNRSMLGPTKVASEDCDLAKTVPSQSEAESATNQASGQTSSQSDDNRKIGVEKSV